MTETSKTVFNYVKEANGKEITAKMIAEATGLGIRQVNGAITAFARTTPKREALMERITGEVFNEEKGVHDTVKIVQLTEAGKAFDPDAEAKAE